MAYYLIFALTYESGSIPILEAAIAGTPGVMKNAGNSNQP
jgi:hypothetical protein